MAQQPGNRHLEWSELTDFAPGLWTVSSGFNVPANAFTAMEKCYPQPGGGLRAWFKPVNLTATGLEGPTSRVIGFFAYSAPHRTLPTRAVDYYAVAYDSATFTVRIARYDTTDAAQTQWTTITTLAAMAADSAPKQADFVGYVKTDGTVQIVVSIGYNQAAAGVYYAPQATVTGSQSFTKIATTLGLGPITVHQNRLVEARGSKVWFTDPGGVTFPVANFVDVEPQRIGADIKALSPNAPGDLLVGKEGAAWSGIQGDLTDPTVITMSEAHYLGHRDQSLVDTGSGLAFMEPAGGIWLTSGGASFRRLDAQLKPQTQPTDEQLGVSYGSLTFMHRWLFTPGGQVYDFQTESWFDQGYSTNFLHVAERFFGTVIMVVAGAPPVLLVLTPDDTGAATRWSSYSFTTAPLRAPDGRQIEVREVQVFVEGDVDDTVTVTARDDFGNSDSEVLTLTAAGAQKVTAPLRIRAEVIYVTVAVASGDGSEAPQVEAVRIGWKRGHRLR